MATTLEELCSMYQIYFGCAPDEGGFNFWLQSGYSFEQIAVEFKKSD